MKNLFSLLSNYKKQVLFIFVLTSIQIFSMLFLPNMIAKIIDIGVVNNDIPYILQTGFYMMLVAIIGSIASITIGYISSKVSSSISRELRYNVFSNSIKFSVNNFDKIGVSSLITRTTNDVTQVQTFIIICLRLLIMAPFMMIGAVFMAVSRSVEMSGIILFSIPFIFLVVFIISKKGFSVYGNIQKGIDKINNISREKLTGIRVIRAFNKDETEKIRFDKNSTHVRDISISINRILMLTQPLLTLILNFTVVAVIYFGAIQISNNSFAVGDLIAFIQYVQQIMMSCMMVSMIFIFLPRAVVSVNRIKEVLDMKAVAEESDGGYKSGITDGNVVFKDVSYKFEDSDAYALKNLNFTINKGEVTAFVGSTGSGKSTIVKLLVRLYDVTDGAILIDGNNINDYNVQYLRSNISYVAQKAMLFSGTIKKNILYGNKSADDQKIEESLKDSKSYDFVMNKGDGLDSSVSQSGSNFSGGQKQRLSISRSLIKDSFLYVFDDSFSALDYKTDVQVRKNIMSKYKDKSIVIIAQRIRTVINADKIIVIDNGEIVGQGKHDELLVNCPVYSEIVSSQISKEDIGE